MSSVQRFLKQVAPSNAFVGAGALATLRDTAHMLVPTSANVVANYPSSGGALVEASDDLKNAIMQVLANTPSPVYAVVLRDMGKTVFGPTASSAANAANGVYQSTYGYFRQVQLLTPLATNATQVGGSTGSAFGVLGSSPLYSPYLTFYLPVPVAGVLLQDANFAANNALAAPVIGGQM